MRLGRTTVLYFLSLVIVSAAGFTSRFAIAFLLGEAVLGRYAVIVALGFFWLPLVGTAVARGISKRMSEGRDQSEYMTAGFGVNAAIAVLTGGAVLLLGTGIDQLSIETTSTLVVVLTERKELVALLAVAAIAFRTSMAGLVGQEKVIERGAFDAVERLTRTTGQVVLILVGAGLLGLVFGHIASLLLVGALALLFYDIGVAKPTWGHAKRILGFSRYDWASTFQGHVFGWMDVIILSLFVSDGLIGIYEVAWGLGSLLGTLSTSIRSTLFPEISSLAADDEYGEIRHILGEGVALNGLLVIPGLFGAVAIGERVLEIYRPSFAKGAGILLILIGAYLVDVYGSQFVDALNALDRPELTYRINLLFVGLNLVLNVLLVWKFSWYGAAVATALSAVIRTGLSYRRLVDTLGHIEVPVEHIGWQIVASVLMTGVVVLLNGGAPRTRLWTVALVAAGAAVYAVSVVAFSSLVRKKIVGLVRML